MKYIYLIIISLLLLGCSTNDIDYTLARAAGNKPAGFFYFANSHDTNHYMFHHKDFDMLMPETYKKDWIDMGGWNGAYIYGGIGVGLEIKETKKYGDVFGYGINMNSSVGEYGDRAKAIEYKDTQYIQSHIKYGKDEYGKEGNINVHYETHGIEHYSCIVKEMRDIKHGVKRVGYDCYKFNQKRTKAKSVTITIIYTKSPNLPEQYKHLAKEYTYKDLLKRSQRVLDSLYIKDGWDE